MFYSLDDWGENVECGTLIAVDSGPLTAVAPHRASADLGVMGTWIGMTVGVAFSSLVFLWGIAQSDWPLLAEQARKRAAGESSGDQVGLLAGGSGSSDDEESVAGGGGALDAMSRRSTASSSEKSQAAV